MARYQTWITTPLTRAAAFAELSRFDRAAEWDPGVDEGSMLTPEPVGLGSRFVLHARFLGRTLPLVYEVVDFEADTRIGLRAENAFVASDDTIRFETLGAGAEITYDARLRPKGLARIGSPLFALAFRRIGDRAAEGLRRHLNPDPSA